VNCLAVRERLPEHALGSLSEGEATRLDEHLAWCAACRKEASELQRAAATLAYSVAPVEPPDDLEDRVVQTVRTAARRRRTSPRRRRGVAAGLLAAAIAFSGLAWGAVMAGRADRVEQQRDAALVKQREAIERFQQVVERIEGGDPSNIVELADLSSSKLKNASGQALVLLSPSSNDFVLVVASGITGLHEGQLPLEVRLTSKDAGELIVGEITALGRSGEGEVERSFVEDLQAFDRIEIRGAHGKVLLRGSLDVHQAAE
jgi:Putative zinc-finger